MVLKGFCSSKGSCPQMVLFKGFCSKGSVPQRVLFKGFRSKGSVPQRVLFKGFCSKGSVSLQGVWPSRSRLNSARTVSESSEGRGTVTDQEMNEDFSMTGSLRRKRQREDSAYLSQRDSMSGGPPQTPSPDIHNEEDQNGYVLPGESPKRGDATTASMTVNLNPPTHRIYC